MRKTSLISLLLAFYTHIAFGQGWKTKVGDLAPQFSITNKEGEKIESKDLRNKVLLINFFATWCPPCREELPQMQEKIWNKLKDHKNFELIILAREEGWDKLEPFIKNLGYSMPFYPDLGRKVFSLFAEDTIPRNVIINEEGQIVYQEIGYSPTEFEELVDVLQKTTRQIE